MFLVFWWGWEWNPVSYMAPALKTMHYSLWAWMINSEISSYANRLVV